MTIDQHQKATFFLQSKKYNQGLEFVRELLSVYPDDDTAFAFIGLYYLGLQNLKEAKIAFVKAIEINPEEFLHYKNIAKIELLDRNPEEANKYIDKGLNLNPADSGILGFKGMVFVSRFNYEEAINLANEGLKLDPTDAQCLRVKAIALSFLNKKDEANELAQTLLSENPVNAQNLLAKGIVDLQNTDNSSIEHIRTSLALQPNNPHLKEALRIALKHNLPGFKRWNNFAKSAGQPKSTFSALVNLLFFLFILISFLYLSQEGLDSTWRTLYLAFWSIGILLQWSFFIHIPLFDTLLFLFSKESRELFSTRLKVSLVINNTFLLSSFVAICISVVQTSSDVYLIALHICSLSILTNYIANVKSKSLSVPIIYTIIVIIAMTASIYEYHVSTLYFIFFNISFRFLTIFYFKLHPKLDQMFSLKK